MVEIIELDDPMKFKYAKDKIESIKKNDNPNYMIKDISDFISDLHMENCIYIKDDIVVPFRITENFMFIVGSNSIISEIYSNLKKIEFDFSKLNKVKTEDVYSGKLDKYPYYYIIDSTYFVYDE